MALNEKATCECGKTYTVWRNRGIKTSSKCPTCTMKAAYAKASKKEKNKPSKKMKRSSKSSHKAGSSKSLDKKLDTAWSMAIKVRAGFTCEHCGKTKALNSHHIESRAKLSVRWSLNNGICLCVGCHIGPTFSAHKTPLSFIPWLTKKRGQKAIDLLLMQSRIHGKFTSFEKEVMLEELNKFIKENK